jgi:hypothetical protein
VPVRSVFLPGEIIGTSHAKSDEHGETVSGLLTDVEALIKRVQRMYEVQIDEEVRVIVLYHLYILRTHLQGYE